MTILLPLTNFKSQLQRMATTLSAIILQFKALSVSGGIRYFKNHFVFFLMLQTHFQNIIDPYWIKWKWQNCAYIARVYLYMMYVVMQDLYVYAVLWIVYFWTLLLPLLVHLSVRMVPQRGFNRDQRHFF